MTFWTYQNLAGVTQGRWLVEPDDLGAPLTGLWHDTREIQPGQAYLAIAGENFDGHDFVDQAFDAGAALAIVQTEPATSHQPPAPVLQVADTVKALQNLARAYRDELKAGGCKVIGIAGPNGKTTTRHLIHHILTFNDLKGTQSQKSFNNHLGVPLTLLSARPDDDFVACEIGTNHPGEVAFLSEIVRPDIAVITSIGEEHMEFFKDLDGVAEEEMSICDHLVEDGVVVARLFEFDQMLRDRLNGKHQLHTIYDGDLEPPLGFRLLGEHNHTNACTANRVADLFGLKEPGCSRALLSVEPAQHRGELIDLGYDVKIYDDCYNANPGSMRAAIDTLLTIDRPGRYVAILGDMFELGEQSDASHKQVVRYAGERVSAIFIGERFSRAASEGGEGCPAYEWTNRTPGDVADLLKPGDTVLLKASRGMRLERLIPAIERRFGPAQEDKPT